MRCGFPATSLPFTRSIHRASPSHRFARPIRRARCRCESPDPRWKLRLNPDRAIVTIRRGSVKLWGSVPNWEQGREIERAIRTTRGVVKVENHLKIEP